MPIYNLWAFSPQLTLSIWLIAWKIYFTTSTTTPATPMTTIEDIDADEEPQNHFDAETIFSSKFTHWNESLRKAKIIPEILPTDIPRPLTVLYFDDNIEYGTLLEEHRVDIPPVDLDWVPKIKEHYTVVFTDPDYPNPKNPTKKEYLHWMVTNVQDAYIRNGETIAQYVPPTNQNQTCKGIHRMVYVVYRHPKGYIKMDPSEYTPHDDLEHNEVIPHNRERFSSKNFAKKYGVIPYAANYFCMNMDFVE